MGNKANEHKLPLRFDNRLENLRKLSEQNFCLCSKDYYRKCFTDYYIYLIRTKFDMAAAWQTGVTLYCAVLFEAIKQPLRILQSCRNGNTHQAEKKTKKSFIIYSINISLYYSTQQYYLYVSKIQTNSRNYIYNAKHLLNTINSRKN